MQSTRLTPLVGLLVCLTWCELVSQTPGSPPPVQASVVLTVAESKRLIAKWVAQMPAVRAALTSGTVVIAAGTTNTYVAEEILRRPIERGALVTGRTMPAKGGTPLKLTRQLGAVILIDGKEAPNITLGDAAERLRPGDVVIKGGNALNYERRVAAVLTGSSDGGTSGLILPAIEHNNAHLVVPIGLEKQVADKVEDIVARSVESLEELNRVYRMRLLQGAEIVTEIEAIQGLTGTRAFPLAAGGIGGAEGSMRLLLRGSREQVSAALKLIDTIQGEPPFVE
jgi:hypothetical protein